MIGGKSVVGVICARGGSKGVRRKNVRVIGGKPLIAWTIEAAQHSRLLDRIILSSEDPEIIAVAASHGCEAPFIRPAALATDEASIYDVLFHALDTASLDHDYIVLLQPTSPLRISEDIDGCIAACHEAGAPACIAITDPPKSPYWMFDLDAEGHLLPLLPQKVGARRQDLPGSHVISGACYVARVDWFRRTRNFLSAETIGYRMPQERSIDIDTDMDLRLFELLLEHQQVSVDRRERS
jgi:CMP-N-acetylneuraminic acid synthetase